MLQVAYTSRPPFFSRRLAEARIAACLRVNSSILPGDWRNFRSGLRRSVPRPLHGASTSTRSILPDRRFTLRSFSCEISIGWVLLAPEGFRGGLWVAGGLSGGA